MISPELSCDGPQPIVSLVVPIRNEAEHIGACLRSVQAQTYPRDLIECIVVDGESSDDTVGIVERLMAEDDRIHLLVNRRRGMTPGLNMGIQAATGTFVGVVSGHAILPSDYVARSVDAIGRTGAWSVGGRIVRMAKAPMQRAIAIATASRIGVGDSAHNYALEAGWVETVFPGFWRRELFDRIGLFDPAMTANEDNELSLRIRKAGGRIWFDPEIRVDYVPRATLGELLRQYRSYGTGKMRVLRKHGGGLRWRHFVPAVWVAFLGLGALLSILIPSFILVWLLGLGLYAGILIIAGRRLRRDGARWWQVTAALAILHLAYGVGTWTGLATWWSATPRG